MFLVERTYLKIYLFYLVMVKVQTHSMSSTNKNNSNVVSRFYNHLSFNGSRVVKGVPKDRHKKETEWFKEAKNRIPENIPLIYKYNKQANSKTKKNLKYYEMQEIDGSNLYQWAILNQDDFSGIFIKLVKLTKKLHRTTHKPNKEDIYQMYFLKPMNALNEFINQSQVETNEIIINGQKYPDPINKLKQKYTSFEKKLLDTKYSFIHGDLTMSNILVSKKGNLYLIDPRGCFGKTNLFGDVRYDVAKLYYSIVGNFDSLNNGKFEYKSDTNNNHIYSITDIGLGEFDKIIMDSFGEQNDIIRYIHATIWLSLIPHTNNSNQKWCTFSHGVHLLNTINDYENQ